MIAIIDFGMGNVRSVQNAFTKVGFQSKITADLKEITDAKAIVLPGVGAFRDAINNLRDKKIDEALIQAIKLNKPFLGICLGMQLLLSCSEEGGKYEGLNLLSGTAKRFQNTVKCPHMGWNSIKYIQPSVPEVNPLYKDIPDNAYFYFVHSYYCQMDDRQLVSTVTNYGIDYSSSFRKKNLFGVQFHPEKSSTMGLKILRNFGELR